MFNHKWKASVVRRLFHVTLALLMIGLPVIPSSETEIIGSVFATDIRAYINGSEIPAYNINGRLAVVVSDLNNYGFTTRYDNDLPCPLIWRNTARCRS